MENMYRSVRNNETTQLINSVITKTGSRLGMDAPTRIKATGYSELFCNT